MINDANDYLVSHGAEALAEFVRAAKLVRVDGLLRMSEVTDPPVIEAWLPGFPHWNGRVKLARSMLSVVTGQPGHGKTTLFAQIWYNILRTYNLAGVFGSFETRPKPHYQRMMRQVMFGTAEWKLTPEQIAKADTWIQDQTLWLVRPDRQPDLGWVLDAAEAAVVRHGAAVLQIDPWNRLIPDRGKFERETDFVSRALDRCLDFAKGMNVHVQIIAHPSKGEFAGRKHHPSLEDISGSKHWENKADQGFVVWRPSLFNGTERSTEAELYHLKARYSELGYLCRLKMKYDHNSGIFVSSDETEPKDDTARKMPGESHD